MAVEDNSLSIKMEDSGSIEWSLAVDAIKKEVPDCEVKLESELVLNGEDEGIKAVVRDPLCTDSEDNCSTEFALDAIKKENPDCDIKLESECTLTDDVEGTCMDDEWQNEQEETADSVSFGENSTFCFESVFVKLEPGLTDERNCWTNDDQNSQDSMKSNEMMREEFDNGSFELLASDMDTQESSNQERHSQSPNSTAGSSVSGIWSVTENLFACLCCDLRSEDWQFIKTHASECPLRGAQRLKIHYEQPALYSCKQCPALYTSRPKFKQHLLTHFGNEPFSCTKCSTRFKSVGDLQTHMSTHSGNELTSTMQDSPRFQSVSDEDQATEDKYLSSHTGNELVSSTQGSSRFKSNPDPQTDKRVFLFQVPVRSSARLKSKNDPRRKSMTNSQKLVTCMQCSIRFKSISDLHTHLMSHSSNEAVSGPRSSKRRKLKHVLKKHLVGDSGEELVSCVQCRLQFKSVQDHYEHLMIHSV